MALDLVAELEALVDALHREDVDYAVCGGLALAMHGHPRATMDIDLLVAEARVDDVLRIARTIGFDVPARRMTFGLRAGRPRVVHRVSKLDADTQDLLPLDVLVVSPELAPVWADRVELVVGSRRIAVVSREGLATMKRIAGRPQDLADLAALEGNADDELE
ncbi:MAG: nucleotidyl transferase AbiEii/AbiGii toxin family protein [Deltaproteobacteria bacterium]|nr:nucleotidyl transferase AbiEii/AbiGii toxin family protein [Kofleriaceae bacterium]